ncbi:MAG: 16S rRNA (cytosine(1402)-N(4))-methyltransferase RsmH [Chloroflexi bacterium]|nr:16S rRNA (cytosine(1402)-N(4))-methyltransferase RsmH [Chloroflexota bacterium]
MAAHVHEHTPVLLGETLVLLNVRAGGRYVDATVGGGGHAEAILSASAREGQLLGLDRDPTTLDAARARLSPFGERVCLVHASFATLARLARTHGFDPCDGILFDLGLSSLQLADAERGFSVHADAPLDLRFDPSSGPTAADLIATLPEDELARMIWRYGEEPRARAIARALVRARARRPLRAAREVAQVVAEASGYHGGRTHPATRTFQALRIAVNDELAAIEAALPQAVDILAPGGRLVVIAFHSLEDRLVKRFLHAQAHPCICPPRLPACVCGRQSRLRILTPKAVRPLAEELARNPRSRSARLRAAERLP